MKKKLFIFIFLFFYSSSSIGFIKKDFSNNQLLCPTLLWGFEFISSNRVNVINTDLNKNTSINEYYYDVDLELFLPNTFTGLAIENENEDRRETLHIVFEEGNKEVPATMVEKSQKDMHVKKVHGNKPYTGKLTDMDIVEVKNTTDDKLYLFYNGLGHDDSLKEVVNAYRKDKSYVERLDKVPHRFGLFHRFVTKRFLE